MAERSYAVKSPLAVLQSSARAIKTIYGSATNCPDRVQILRGMAEALDRLADMPTIEEE